MLIYRCDNYAAQDGIESKLANIILFGDDKLSQNV